MNSFGKLGIMIDCSRNGVMRPETVKKFIELIAKMGYNCILLYMEDVYEVENQPYFGHQRGRYTKEDLKSIDDFGYERGIEVIPCIQTLSHLEAPLKWPCYSNMKDYNNTLLAGDDRVYQLIDSMFATVNECFRSKCVNVGMDEASFLGMGRYKDKHGIENPTDILLKHLYKVSDLAEKYGFELSVWSDMFFKLLGNGDYYNTETDVDCLSGKIPHNVRLIYWDYYSKDKKHFDERIQKHKRIAEDIYFAGGIWTWTGFAPHISFSVESARESIISCAENGVKDIYFTLWGDNGNECSRFSVLPAIYAAGQFANGNFDMPKIKEGFAKLIGVDFDDFCLAELPDTPNIRQTASDDSSDANWINAEKYLLYNDCFMGKFDCIVTDGLGEKYAEAAKKLEKVSENNDYADVFETLNKLCRVLELKAEIGIRTRKAYKDNDKASLSEIIKDYNEILIRIEEFYVSFRKQWYNENKPQGFEVQDARIGGLIKRVSNCKDRLNDYVDGKINRIIELEEPMLEYRPNGAESWRKSILFNSWSETVTSGNI
ncbi:MAG: beta-N-acetylhexosaminidase [Clostridia bacterium]|nr:beta-N-acetylhexosaminidase [Clostridia bacterium]